MYPDNDYEDDLQETTEDIQEQEDYQNQNGDSEPSGLTEKCPQCGAVGMYTAITHNYKRHVSCYVCDYDVIE